MLKVLSTLFLAGPVFAVTMSGDLKPFQSEPATNFPQLDYDCSEWDLCWFAHRHQPYAYRRRSF
jgi:hypothetical protein